MVFEMPKKTPYQMLLEFHKTYNVAINQPLKEDLIGLREKLMIEELQEVEDELWPNVEDDNWEKSIDKKKLTKELADLMYVVIGTAVTFGLPLEEVFTEVHKSNMSKLGDDGKPIYREDGKVLKGPNYKEPELDKFFD
jgi:predicted HAD superfamily Cof-like phosphohydrolase